MSNFLKQLRDILLLLVCRPDRLALICCWRLCGKKLRAQHRLQSAIAALPFANQRWMSDAGSEDLALIAIARWREELPSFCVHLHLESGDDQSAVRKAIRSALQQSERPVRIFITTSIAIEDRLDSHKDVCILREPCQSLADGLRLALAEANELSVDYLVPLSVSGSLPRHAIAGYASFVIRQQLDELPVLYGDEIERVANSGGAVSWLKPLWDRRMILSQDYVSSSCALPVKLALRFVQDDDWLSPKSVYELVLRISLTLGFDASIQKVQRITMFTHGGAWCARGETGLIAVQSVAPSDVEVSAGPFGSVQLRWTIPCPMPKVSIIVATRDKIDLLRTCVEGVLLKTDYPSIDLIIADNDSRETEVLEFLEEIVNDGRVRVVRWPHLFNYSAINNYAAGFAKGEYICLLNNDIEVIEPNWLTELVREAVQPGVGAVGARLLYPDRSIQHAGVAIGIGNAAGHAHRGLPEGQPGYFAQALIARGTTAVTGACLLVSKKHFDGVGGLDERGLAVAYSDVDFCLKLRKLGLSNIYTPAATLIHHESKSRGADFAPNNLARYLRELAVFQQRWDTTRIVDPWHHSRLSRNSETFRVAP
ncbi:MAG: hypothetical protein CMN69_07915 [Sphingomonadaceae bacterium]|nr:hypothetical protein [Sphingomonadaceae bacterium]|tara:strand:- start:368 stop:2152 length:1785 start_codon:yes stop_codon:yes gene_type:complete